MGTLLNLAIQYNADQTKLCQHTKEILGQSREIWIENQDLEFGDIARGVGHLWGVHLIEQGGHFHLIEQGQGGAFRREKKMTVILEISFIASTRVLTLFVG